MKNILRTLSFLVLALCAYTANAQKPKDFYVSYPQPNGMLFHIFPTTFFQHKTDGDLTFDITYQCQKDSAVINFTYYASHATPLDSIRFTAGKISLAGKTEKLFIEARTLKKWEHRYSLKVPVKSLFFFFNPEETPHVNLYANSTAKDYDVKKAEWNKKAPIYQTIIRTIRMDCEK